MTSCTMRDEAERMDRVGTAMVGCGGCVPRGHESPRCERLLAAGLSIAEDAPLAMAAERMRSTRARTLVVTSASDPSLVIGVVTDLDLLRCVARQRRAA
jgi:CBS domain-containing protein